MHKDGHVGVSLLLYAPLVAYVSLREQWLLPYAILGAVALVDLWWPVAFLTDLDLSFSFAMIPDLDMRVSFVKHRGITHTVWFAAFAGGVTAALTYGPAWYVAREYPEYLGGETVLLGTAFMGGIGVFSVLTHLLGDVLTPMGITPFAPVWSRRFTLSLWRADNSIANTGLYFLGVFAVLLGFGAEQVLPAAERAVAAM